MAILENYTPDKRYTSLPFNKGLQLEGVDLGISATTGALFLEFDKFMLGKAPPYISTHTSGNYSRKEAVIQQYEGAEASFLLKKKRYLAVFASLKAGSYEIGVPVTLPGGKPYTYMSKVKIVAGEVGTFDWTEITYKELMRLEEEKKRQEEAKKKAKSSSSTKLKIDYNWKPNDNHLLTPMYCRWCGKKLTHPAIYCPNCGRHLPLDFDI